MSQRARRVADGDARALKITLDRLVANTSVLLGVPFVSVALLDPDTGELVSWAELGDDAEESQGTIVRSNEGIAGWVAAHLEPVIVNDARADARFTPRPGWQVGSLLCVPLIDQDQLLGTLTVASPELNAFDARRQQLLQIFSDQAVLAISKTRQAEAAKAQARELGALLDATRALTSSLDPSHVFAYIVTSIRKVIMCEDAVIFALDEHRNALRVVTGFGPRMERLGEASVDVSDTHSIAAWVARHQRARVTGPGADDVGDLTSLLLSGEQMALLCVPLVSKDRLRGVIMLAREEPFQAGELGAMLNLSNIVAATLENVELYQEARAERERQAAVYAVASDAIAVVDDNLKVIEANESFARLAGQTVEQALGQRACDVLQMHLGQACELCDGECLLSEVVRVGESMQHIECELMRSDPETQAAYQTSGRRPSMRYVDFSVTPVTGPQGRRLLLVGRDVTAFREMEQLKANFLSMVSHELRAPLQTINGYLDLTMSGMAGDVSEQQREFLRRARSGSEHLTALVDDLLLISRRDAGQFALNREDIDLARVIHETAQELEIAAEDADVRLVVEVPHALPVVYADGPRMAQVVRNLLTNAIKFTRSGGTVQLSADVTNQHVILRVRDSGVGIAPEHLGRIFDRFYQVASTAPRGRAHGQGLGLAIVRIIVEGHGGRIEVESTPRLGSTFSVVLPRADAQANTAGVA